MTIAFPSTTDDILDANAASEARSRNLSFPDWLREYDDEHYQRNLAGTLTVHEAAVALYQQFREIYGAPCCGATRATFIDEDNGVVYKVPMLVADEELEVYGDDEILDRYLESIAASQKEARDCASGDYEEFPVAACRMIDNEYGLPVLVMEYVDTEIGDHNGLPTWINCVDSGQAGYTKNGDFVVYDWGNA